MQSHILLASDETCIRDLMTTILTKAGYRITSVRNGAVAVSKLLSDQADFALAILDGQLPPISGNRTLAILREAGCQLPIILASGSFIVGEIPLSDPRVVFLSKPFRPAELLEAVERLLQERN